MIIMHTVHTYGLPITEMESLAEQMYLFFFRVPTLELKETFHKQRVLERKHSTSQSQISSSHLVWRY